MCGIIAIVGRDRTVGREALLGGRDRMERRGPDACGQWWNAEATVALGHRRLSILDLDSRANQPLVSPDGRYVALLNGEIYNFRSLRAELEAAGHAFRTTSDTEVVLALFEREGGAMLPRLRGMFAVAIWDDVERQLFVARDPYGIKPLYLARTSSAWLVASQVKALLATGLVSREPDPAGQAGFWLLGSVPEPHSWFRDISALPAGHYATITAEGVSEPVCWWDVAEEWRRAPLSVENLPEVPERVRAALLRSVEAHLVADVPVGVFLSGGIDSGSLALLMLEAGMTDLQGVTVAFGEFAGRHEDESPRAALLARRFGIRHTVKVVTRQDFESDLPRILAAMDQPSVDGINTWYAAKAVAEAGLKVVVSGVGGDELFQGYASFERLPRVLRLRRGAGWIPGAMPLLRSACAWQARRTGNPRWKTAPRLTASIEGAWFLSRGVLAEEEVLDAMGGGSGLAQPDGLTLVRRLVGELPAEPRLALAQIESVSYLRNQLLRDSDWASMDHSVELRTPLVDAWLLRELRPVLRAFSRFPGKQLLAGAPRPPLAPEIAAASKTGFGIPVMQWLGFGDGRGARPRAAQLAAFVAANCY
jgi:asparagine synthase (glutamine-hydrolysing)